MSPNPYEPPQEVANAKRVKRSVLVISGLTVLSIPAAGIAGLTTCYGVQTAVDSLRWRSVQGPWTTLACFAAATLIVLLTFEFYQSRYKRGTQRLVVGLAAAGGILLFMLGAIPLAGFIGLAAYDSKQKSPLLTACVIICIYLILIFLPSLGGMLGIVLAWPSYAEPPQENQGPLRMAPSKRLLIAWHKVVFYLEIVVAIVVVIAAGWWFVQFLLRLFK